MSLYDINGEKINITPTSNVDISNLMIKDVPTWDLLESPSGATYKPHDNASGDRQFLYDSTKTYYITSANVEGVDAKIQYIKDSTKRVLFTDVRTVVRNVKVGRTTYNVWQVDLSSFSDGILKLEAYGGAYWQTTYISETEITLDMLDNIKCTIDSEFAKLFRSMQSPMYNGNVYMIGDSNTQFLTQSADITWAEGFKPYQIGFATKANSGAGWYWEHMYNQDLTQTTNVNIASTQVNNFLENDSANFDVCIIMLGTNDMVKGTIDDEIGSATMCGCMKWCLEQLTTNFSGKILGVLPPHRYDSTAGTAYSEMDAKVELMRKIYGMYSVKILDAYNEGNIVAKDMREDMVHLGATGRQKLVDLVVNAVLEM